MDNDYLKAEDFVAAAEVLGDWPAKPVGTGFILDFAKALEIAVFRRQREEAQRDD